MPPKRKRSTNLDDSETEDVYPDVSVHEDERTAPKKRGRKSIIDAILQEEARGTPAPVLPQNQWNVSIVTPQDLTPTVNVGKRRKVRPAASSLVNTRNHPPPGTPPVWGAGKGDFYSAFKSLTESFGGICFAKLGTFPVLAWLVEGPRPPEDTLDGEILTLSLVTEFRPRDQPAVSNSSAGSKKRGRQNRRTKREDLAAELTDLDNPSNTFSPSNTRIGTGPPPEDLKPAPGKQWPFFVPAAMYDPKYPTICECFQPRCPGHCSTGRDLLLRHCTNYSWPGAGIVGLRSLGIPQARHLAVFNEDPSAFSEHEPKAQGEDPSTSIPVLSSRLPLDTAKMYAQTVPELASLLDHMERKDPMLVISTTDASMESVLPFQLPSKYGCVVLGFFNVESVECENRNCAPAPSIQPCTLSWRVQLRYASPSDATDANGNLAPPWWLPPPITPVPPDAAEPFLPPPVPEPEDGSAEAEASGLEKTSVEVDKRWCIVQALDGSEGRPWWHCLGCGRINQRDMLTHRRCPSCQRNEKPAPPSVIEDVLQDSSTAPYPFDHAPRSMNPGDISVKEFSDRTSVYCYNFPDEPLPAGVSSAKGACVKHIFTGPCEDLKIQATDLFYQIQEGIELSWQSVKTGIAEGPYYSWASPHHGWVDKEIPRCIHQTRKLIYQFVKNYGEKDPGGERDLDETPCEETTDKPAPSTSSHGASKEGAQAAENVRINHVVALAWTASGSKRGIFVSAKDNPVFILCLGATVELELERCIPEQAAVVNTEDNPQVDCDVVIPEVIVEEPGKKAKGKTPRKSQKPVPQSSPEASVNPKGTRKNKGKEKAAVPQPKPKPSAPAHERLKISMVHGDVLILSGGDFIYALTRIGMSILLFGLADAQY